MTMFAVRQLLSHADPEVRVTVQRGGEPVEATLVLEKR
jgi:hypothetical protein